MNQRTLRFALLTSLSGLAFPALAAAQADAGVAETARDVPTTEVAPPSALPDPATTTEAPPPTDEHHEVTGVAETPAPIPPPPVEPAQPPPPPPTPTGPQAPTTPTPSATGASSAPPLTAMVAGVAVRLTGILWGSAFAGTGVESYGWANSAAPTSALNPLLLGNQAGDAQLSFQVQQSRFGLTLGEGSPFRGTIEIDFIHFDQQSSPTTQAFPRIRIAMLEWHFDANNRIFVGQGWDIFGNTNASLLSHSSNLVGTLFQAGNIGFMRQQIGYSGRFGPIEIALAIGMQGNNAGPTFNNLEESATPTGSARVMYHFTETSVIGISGLGTAPRFTQTNMMTGNTAEQRRLALGGEAFADVTIDSLNIHAEAYIAQNLANTGALNLGQGRFGFDVADAGGYLSGRLTLGEWAVTAMYGFAGLLNPSQAVPAYSPAAAGSAPFAPYTTNVSAGPGMEWNMTGHVGVWFSPMRGLSFVLEPYFYYTRFILAASDLAGGTSPNQLSGGGQFTTMFQF